MLDRGGGFVGVHPESPLVYEALAGNQMRMQQLQLELQELRRLELELERPWWQTWRLRQLEHELEELRRATGRLWTFFAGRATENGGGDGRQPLGQQRPQDEAPPSQQWQPESEPAISEAGDWPGGAP